jgi:hypothetical protein
LPREARPGNIPTRWLSESVQDANVVLTCYLYWAGSRERERQAEKEERWIQEFDIIFSSQFSIKSEPLDCTKGGREMSREYQCFWLVTASETKAKKKEGSCLLFMFFAFV